MFCWQKVNCVLSWGSSSVYCRDITTLIDASCTHTAVIVYLVYYYVYRKVLFRYSQYTFHSRVKNPRDFLKVEFQSLRISWGTGTGQGQYVKYLYLKILRNKYLRSKYIRRYNKHSIIIFQILNAFMRLRRYIEFLLICSLHIAIYLSRL